MHEHDFPAGTVIFHAGEPGDRAYLIHDGTVELLSGAVRLAQVGPGEVVGEMSLIEERPHRLTARALTAVKASGLTRSQFETQLISDPAAVRIYLKSLFERMRALQTGTANTPEAASAAPKPISVIIHPLTRRAAETLPQDGLVIMKFPYRIGRAAEVREKEPLDLNDLWLLDGAPFSVSRNHALIDRHGDTVLIKDRGSSLGIYVNDVHIGGRTPTTQAALEDGDNVVIIGGRVSPFQFRIEVLRG
jgi:CRP-like cAMP-binding protein